MNPHKGKDSVENNMVEVEKKECGIKEDTPSSDHPQFAERPNIGEDYNFEEDIVWLPLSLSREKLHLS